MGEWGSGWKGGILGPTPNQALCSREEDNCVASWFDGPTRVLSLVRNMSEGVTLTTALGRGGIVKGKRVLSEEKDGIFEN